MLRKSLYTFYCFWILVLSSCSSNPGKTLNLATAANMQFAMEALTQKFTEQTGISTNIILGSSGKLTAQIIAGAPYDLFISADMNYPQTIFEAGLANSKPKVYAAGQLVLWTYEAQKPSLPDALLSNKVEQIALANPKTAPYGKAAMETMASLQLYQRLKPKMVFGESIAQTNQFITSKAATLGFTSKAVVLSPRQAGKGSWVDVPTHYHNPILQGVVVLKNRNTMTTEAKQFYDFLFSEAAKEILNKFGYTSVD